MSSEFKFSEQIKQLEIYLKEKNVKNFDYSQCKDLKQIGEGGFGIVYSATFQGTKYALKSLRKNLQLQEEDIRDFKDELENFYKIEDHPNVIKFYGISRDSNDFLFVLQLADGGNLRDYLFGKQKDNFYEISWSELIQIANDIANGLNHLHNNRIIHRDLHSKNILIHDNRALISDFGISKQMDYSTSGTQVKGMMAYIEPQCILQYKMDDNKKVFKRDKKSDIYSLGMLLWELTSGVPPFYRYPDYNIMHKIINMQREIPILNTPSDYTDLYRKCWSTNPDERPIMSNILETLNNLSKTTDNFKMQNKIDKLSNLSAMLSEIYIDLTNNGSEFKQISKLIKESIKQKETPEHMFEYLCENQDSDLNSCILGFFYLEGIGTSENHENAFNIFKKTADQISISKFYLGECFRCGYGTEKNLKSAISWYEKAEADGHARSINALGLCHIKGIGVKNDKNKAFDYFKKSYEMGYIPSCNNLGNCYEFGRGTKTNKVKAFEYYREAASQNCSSGQYNVSECYKNGIGTKKNLDEAKRWYKKATNNGYRNTTNSLWTRFWSCQLR
ncbi:kinase-like domain-containing protein [Gigaspora rosea]|uniref:Kinase-like domain-containing protein n=1 Tax=Gigaspora rosea TaxID=44941 RepID=A0A397V362_9GLOM|nr:kinase-like domain-containing protein [Gigaspora rosea]